MRAILIDPTERSITEVNIGSGIAEIYRVMGCERFTSGARRLNGSLEEGYDTLWADDTDLLEPGEDESLRPHWQKDPRDWYQVDADRNPPSSFPLSGRGLVVGIDDMGETCDARISLDELKSRITFTKRKFKGFVTRYTSTGIAVTVDAPVIEA